MKKLNTHKISIITRKYLWQTFFKSIIQYGMEISILNGKNIDKLNIIYRKSIRTFANLNRSSNLNNI